MPDENREAGASKVRKRRVERRIASARDSLPGERNDLPEGALGELRWIHKAMRTAVPRTMRLPFRADIGACQH